MDQNQIYILPNTSYILSGSPCSGKSTFIKKIIEQGVSKHAIVCPDQIRENILGYKPFIDNNGSGKFLYGWHYEGDFIFEIVEKIIKARLNQGLPVFVDATNLTDTIRTQYAKIFYNYQQPFEVLIFDVPVDILKKRLEKREFSFLEDKDMSKVVNILEKKSIYPYKIIKPDSAFSYVSAPTSHLDFIIVGDTHGLLEPLVKLLQKDGFKLEDNKFTHKEGKRILFLGDVVCRGKNSLELLDIVKNTIENGTGWMLKGNHEIQLIRAIDFLRFNEKLSPDMSLSTTQTLKEFCRKSPEQQQQIFNFLRSLPYSLSFIINKETLKGENILNNDDSQFKIAFGHSALNYFHPSVTPGEELSYNQTPYSYDTHDSYESNYWAGNNQYVYIHARTPNKDGKHSSTFSLADSESFNGHLVSFDLISYVNSLREKEFVLSYELFEKSIKKEKTNFDFLEKNKLAIGLRDGITALNKNHFFDKAEKGEKHTNSMGLKMYVKKNKNSHPSDNTLLDKCNGLVIDNAGSIIVNPRPDYKSAIKFNDGDLVYAINQSSDSIFYVFKNPYNNEISTTSSRSFTVYQEDIQFVAKNLEKFEKYFLENNVTLGFETRIIENSKKIDFILTYGQKNSMRASPFNEEQLDEVAEEIQVTRPIFKITDMADVRDKCSYTSGLGYVVRKVNNPNELFFVPSDLVIFHKICNLLSKDGGAKFFFNKPEIFMEKFVTEDMEDIVKYILDNNKMETFTSLSQDDRKLIIFESMNTKNNLSNTSMGKRI